MPEASEFEIEFAVIDRRTEGLQELELSVERLKPGDYGRIAFATSRGDGGPNPYRRSDFWRMA